MSDEIVISIATIPDIDALRVIHQLGDLSDEGVLNAAMHLHNQQSGSRVLPLYQQQIISLAVVKRSPLNKVTIQCLDSQLHDEAVLLKQLDKLMGENAKIIAWKMSTHEWPLIYYRLLKHGITSKNMQGASSIDLSKKLSNNQQSACADWVGLASSLGFPTSAQLSHQETINCYVNDALDIVHESNQTRALNIYQIYLRDQLINAELSADEYQSICESLRDA